jgi:hypothetical protein
VKSFSRAEAESIFRVYLDNELTSMLNRQMLRILAEFGHRTGHEHPHFRTAINNYAVLLSAMGWSEAEILARLRSAVESEPDELAGRQKSGMWQKFCQNNKILGLQKIPFSNMIKCIIAFKRPGAGDVRIS